MTTILEVPATAGTYPSPGEMPWEVDMAFPIEDVIIPDYQRHRKLAERSRKIASKFNWAEFDLPRFNRLPDGTVHCTEGLARLEAFKLMGMTTIPAIIMDVPYPEEVTAFIKQAKNRTSVKLHEAFKGEVERGDEAAIAINDAVIASGFQVGASGGGHIEGVAALKRVYKRSGAEGLTRTLSFARRTWQGDPDVRRAQFIDGLDLFLSVFEKRLTSEKIRVLADISVQAICRNSEASRADYGAVASKCIAEELRTESNKVGTRANKNDKRGW